MHSNNRRVFEMVLGIYKGKRVPCRGAACDAGAVGVAVRSASAAFRPSFPPLSSLRNPRCTCASLRLLLAKSLSHASIAASRETQGWYDSPPLLFLLLLLLCSLSPPLTSTRSYKSLRSFDCNNRYTHTQKNVYRRLVNSPLSSFIVILIFPSSSTIPSVFFLILLVAVKLFFF
jgi:hypothetical protein